jgi:hypothetical protein
MSVQSTAWAGPVSGKTRDLLRKSDETEKIACVSDRPAETPRNPLRNEADMFRVLIIFGIGAAIVIAVALLIGSLAGAIVAAVLIAVGLWRTWGLIQDWRRYGSDPAER